MITIDEERQLIDYLVSMYIVGYDLSPTTLKMKVYEITKARWTPFRDNVLGDG